MFTASQTRLRYLTNLIRPPSPHPWSTLFVIVSKSYPFPERNYLTLSFALSPSSASQSGAHTADALRERRLPSVGFAWQQRRLHRRC